MCLLSAICLCNMLVLQMRSVLQIWGVLVLIQSGLKPWADTPLQSSPTDSCKYGRGPINAASRVAPFAGMQSPRTSKSRTSTSWFSFCRTIRLPFFHQWLGRCSITPSDLISGLPTEICFWGGLTLGYDTYLHVPSMPLYFDRCHSNCCQQEAEDRVGRHRAPNRPKPWHF